jgi:hypothetical protein
MTSPVPPGPWREFSTDPRRPEAAGLRASDRDRDVVLGVLAEGYAEGRLTREEYDERAAATTAARTLGELAPLVTDLVPQRPAGEDLHERAVRHWESERRQAVTGFLIPTVICWTIWVLIGLRTGSPGDFNGTFPWPVFVMLGTAANLVRVSVNRVDIVAEEERRLERRRRRDAD